MRNNLPDPGFWFSAGFLKMRDERQLESGKLK
jgi:hypothetical protein